MATPFTPSFDSARVEQMRSILKLSTLPDVGVEALDDTEVDLGINLDWLKDAKAQLENLNVDELERNINKLNHFTAPVEDATIHFVHERSTRPDAVPLLIIHGWPGLFYDFRNIVKSLTNPEDSRQPAFHVVAPSLPGYAWSTLPRKADFTVEDTARLFNTLMVEVLGYNEYIGQGGDWGSHILRFTGANHYANAKLVHFNMFHCGPAGLAWYTPWLNHLPLPLPQWAVDSVSTYIREWGLSKSELAALRRDVDFRANGSGYSAEQRTRPATIGYAIAASPLSILAYIGEKHIAWSDPNDFDISNVIETTAIYYLTGCFQTSVMVYNQNKDFLACLSDPRNWGNIKSLMAYSAFPYEISTPPKAWMSVWGNLVQYTTHDHGGHFPALDNPDGLVGDLRKFVLGYWKR